MEQTSAAEEGQPALGPLERRQREASERGKRARAARQAKLVRTLDPDGTLSPEELARRVREHYAQIGRRGGKAYTARVARDSAENGPATTTGEETCHGHPQVTGPELVLPPELLERDDMRTVLAARDVSGLYRLILEATAMTQHQLAHLVGQQQSEVSEILSGRQVSNVAVLERIADGLSIPRGLMRLDGAPDPGAYSGVVTVADPCEEAEMLRRHFDRLLALGAAAVVGVPVPGIGDLADLAVPPLAHQLPDRIGASDVGMIRTCREQLAALARAVGGQAQAAVQLVEWGEQWLDADASDAVRRELLSELAHLHTIVAWCCHDCGVPARAHYHFGRAVELATKAGDAYQAGFALRHAGMMLIERGAPNDGLTVLQFADLRLRAAPPDHPLVPVVQAGCHVVSAFALSRLGDDFESTRRLSRSELAQSRDGWEPPTAHARGDMDLITGMTQLHLDRLDVAEATLAVAARTFARSGDRREGVVAELILARLHVQAGEPRGLAMARSAIAAVEETRSGVAQQIWLPPLAEALEARPGSAAEELARMARQVAA